MSGHWRIRVLAFLFVAGLSISPAFSNPLTDLLSPAAPKEDAAAAPASASAPVRQASACASQPGKATPGLHWVYRLSDHRKCWYQADETSVSARRLAHHRIMRHHAVASEDDEDEPRKKKVMDARAQLLSGAQAAARQPAAPAAVDTASVPTNDDAAMPVAPAPAAARPVADQQTAQLQQTAALAIPRPLEPEALLAAASIPEAARAPFISAPPTISAAAPEREGLLGSQTGVVLIALGFAFVMGTLLARRFA